jgi:hypothetical protein
MVAQLISAGARKRSSLPQQGFLLPRQTRIFRVGKNFQIDGG